MNFVNAFVFSFFSVFLTWSHLDAYFHFIPVEISSYNNLPYVEVEVEDKTTFLVVDLGSKLPLSLPSEILESLSTRVPYGTAQWKDVYAKEHETPAYIIPEISFGDVVVNNVVTNISESESTSIKGCIGRTLLSDFNLLLDFSKRLILATDQTPSLKLLGYDLKQFVKASFDGPTHSIILSIELDNGIKRFGLDTGSSISAINASFCANCVFENKELSLPFYSTEKFSIGNHDFGMTDLHAMDFFTGGIIDGILGMDFLRKHVVYIDFEEKQLYIQP